MDGNTLIELFYPTRVVINFYVCLMVTIFYFAFFRPRRKLPAPAAVVSFWVLHFLLSYTAALNIYANYLLKITVAIVVDALILQLLTEGSFIRKLIFSSISFLLLMISEALISIFGAWLLQVSMPMIAGDPDMIKRLLPVVFLGYGAAYLIPSFLSRFMPKHASNTQISGFLIIPLSLVLLVGGFLYAFFISERQFGTADAVTTGIMVAACIGVILYSVRILQEAYEKRRLEDQRDLQKLHYTALMEQQKNIRALRHDIANHLMTVNILARDDKEKADRYIQKLTETFRAQTAIDYCDNRIVDAVLYSKSMEAKNQGVSFSVHAVLPEDTAAEETDLMSLFSNLIDNAIRAAASSEEKAVAVSIRPEAGNILFKIENSVPAGYKLNTGRTTKADKSLHGLGVRIAEDICRKYRGTLDISYRAETGNVETVGMLPVCRTE